jgi:hypothetical protein
VKRSSFMKRGAPLHRGKPLAPRSKKRAAIAPLRAQLVERLLLERPLCEACLLIVTLGPIRCTVISVDVHERLARSAGGSILDEDNCVTTCRWGHDWIGNHPNEATALGIRTSRYNRPRGKE